MDAHLISEFVQERHEDAITNMEAESTYNDAQSQFQTLPDLCLLKIFSDESLDLMDLWNIAQTCKRFRLITRIVIGKTLTFVASKSTFKFYSSKFLDVHVTQSDIERWLQIFGCCIKEVWIGSRNHQPKWYAFNLVKDHCDEALTHIHLADLRIPATLTQEMKPVFQRLHTLYLNAISVGGNRSIFSELNSLSELLVVEVQNCNIILDNVFPKLKRLTFSSNKESWDRRLFERLQAFITNHPCLTFIDIALKCDTKWFRTILKKIASSCADLQELCFHNSSRRIRDFSLALKPLQKLKSLKTLNLSNMVIDDLEVFAPMTGLRELELVLCSLQTDADQFGCLSQLTKLFLIRCDSSGGYDVCDIIQQLVNLVKLKLVDVYLYLDEARCVLNATRFSNIVKIVKKRPHVLTLICRCDSTVKREKGQNVKLIRLSGKGNL